MARTRGGTMSSSNGCGRIIKYDEVYFRAYASVSKARTGIGRYLTFYTGRSPHSSFDGKTLDQAYFKHPIPDAVAA